MSSGLEVLSAISTVISILDAAIRTIKELRGAHERQAALPGILASHHRELRNIRQILWIVQQEKDLQVVSLLEDLSQLEHHGRTLERYLLELSRAMGPIKQFANQLFNGNKSLDNLASIMNSMSCVKANLNIKIQVVHVGLTRSVGDVVLVNCEMVEELDRKLQNLFGEGKGLKLAELVHHKQRDRDGKVHLKSSDIAFLGDSSTLNDETDHAKHRIVDKNKADDESLQINSPIGTDGFEEVTYLTITNNTASKQAIQLNHAVAREDFHQLLQMRLASWRK